MRSLATAALLTLVLTLPASAQTFVFHLRGDQEVPPVPSVATGGCYGVLNQPASQFAITCVHDVVGATIMHIHQAPAGANGPIAFDLGDPASPVTATWTGMTAGDIADLLAGNLYVNIHTAGRPAGEIRGQILPRTVDTVNFTLDGGQVVPPNGTSASGNCTADLSNDDTSLAVQCTHDLPSPQEAHLHQAAAGQNGPVIFTFPSAASPINANVPMTPERIAAFAGTLLAVEVHGPAGTEEVPAAVIRGQIGTPPVPPSTGTVHIVKETSPAGGTAFGFTETLTVTGNFTLDDGDTRTFTSVTPGTYTVTENDPSAGGYTLADVTCDDDGDSEGDPFARTATIRVAAGETVTCTFRNLETAGTDQIFAFRMDGTQETPPIVTPESGGCMARFDVGANELDIVCTHNVTDPTLIHIHRAPAGSAGPIVFDLGSPTSPIVATWSGMTPGDVADLMSGNLYVNIHTAGRPSGAIRGQIVPRSIDSISFPIDGAQMVPPSSTPFTGNCTADLSNDATALAVACTHDFPAPDEAHVHRAPRNENGPEVFTFPSPASPMNGNVPLTPRLVADFEAGFLYVEIHAGSSEETSAAIRGQIAPPVVAVTTGTIRIVKQTVPAGGTGFSFTDDVPGSGAFTLNDGQTEVLTDVPIGTYTVTEGTLAGWSLTDVTCGDNDSTGNPFARTATIRLQGGESVTCTFRNLQNVPAPALFVFHLSGAQEVPPVATAARGGCFGQLDSVARRFTLVCTHNVTDPTIMHIHRAPAGSNGPIAFDLGDPSSPVEAVWENMTAAEVGDLLAGNFYVNIHASGRPAGEIRGQILPRTVDNFFFPANGAQEVPPTDSQAQGRCTADLANDAASVFVECQHNVPLLTDIHLHVAPPGEDGPAIFDFPQTNPFSGNVPLTPRLVADFAAGFLYVNIHSPDYTEGEIRGQLIAGVPADAELIGAPTLSEWALIALVVLLAAVVVWRLR